MHGVVLRSTSLTLAGALAFGGLGACVLGACALGACAQGPPLGFSRGLGPLSAAPPTSAAACVTCHADEHAAWSGSAHARSWTSPLFRASFARARMRAWCLNCHVPLLAQQAALREDRPEPLLAEGVTCAVCHLRGGKVLSAREPSAAARRAHSIVREPALASSELCGGCHQFRAPRRDHFPLRDAGDPMQDTLAEWKRSGETRTCASCHLQGHAFRGAHDPSLVKEALRARLRTEGGAAVLELEAVAIGHALPTGDPFRRLEVQACADAGCAAPLRRWFIGQVFQETADSWARVGDLRLFPGRPRRFALPAGALFWRVVYHYAEEGLQAHAPPLTVVSGAVPR